VDCLTAGHQGRYVDGRYLRSSLRPMILVLFPQSFGWQSPQIQWFCQSHCCYCPHVVWLLSRGCSGQVNNGAVSVGCSILLSSLSWCWRRQFYRQEMSVVALAETLMAVCKQLQTLPLLTLGAIQVWWFWWRVCGWGTMQSQWSAWSVHLE